MSWSASPEWWLSELTSDPAYEAVVTPLLLRTLEPVAGFVYADLGCGDGRVMRSLLETGASVVGIDLESTLAVLAPRPVVVAEIPPLPIRSDAVDGAIAVLALEHMADHAGFFLEAARVVRTEGVLVIVVNHPVWTAPESTPITDTDGEVLWRPGEYFAKGSTSYPAGEGSIVFHHRSLADLTNAAADAGWSLEYMEELPHHDLKDQAGVPRLLACRWRLLP